MPTVDTNAPVEVEVNVTTEAPTIDVQIDGYLRSEIFIVNIAYTHVPSGGLDPGTFRWELSASANEIADAVARGKKIVGHRITSSTGALTQNGYVECLFSGVGGIAPVSATFREITTTGITSYSVQGDSKVATVETVPFSTGGGGGSSDITVDSDLSSTSENPVQNKVVKAAVDAKYTKPSGGIPASDLASAVQTSLGKADTAVQTETDPTVPSWAKSPNKPSYSYSEITGTPTLAAVATSGSYSDLSNTPTIPSLTGYQTEAITDTGGYYTTDTVEGALQEIGAELAGINTLIGSGVIT